jgi:uncharacterized protein involved in outer membrane biogenesis
MAAAAPRDARQRPRDGAPPAPRGRLILAVGLLLIAGATLLATVWDWNWFKPWIERRVEAETGRRFQIGGNFDVDLGWPSARVRAEHVSLANAGWSKTPQMFEAEAVELLVMLRPAWRSRWRLPLARLERPRLTLERVAGQPPNWQFRGGGGSGRRVEIGDLLMDEGQLRVRDVPGRTDLSLSARSGPRGLDDAMAPLLVAGQGRYRGFDFALDGRVESPLALRARQRPYRIDLQARAGATHAHARGQLEGMGRLRNFDLDLTLRGDDLGQLDPLLDLVLPPTPPYRFEGRLRRRGDAWHYDPLQGQLGDSDLRGSATLTLGGVRPHLAADLVSQRLDVDDLAGFVGAPPSGGRGETASAAQRAEAAALAQRERILPRRPWRADRLRRMDADVRLDAPRVDAGALPIDALRGRLRLEAGVVRVDPLTLSVAGGQVDSRLELDASREPIEASADLTLRGLELPKLFAQAELTRSSVGRIGGRVQLQGRGESLAAVLATADGEVGLVMGRGRISNLLLEVAGLDVAEALKFLLGKDRVVPLRCAHADLVAKDGIVTTRRFVFDTTDTVLYGEGTIDLRDERLDLLLRPRPKDKSLVSLRSPLQVDGRLKDPDIHPKPGPLALRGLAAAALYSIAPPASLLALIETGPGKDANCDLQAVAAQGGEEPL